MRTTRSATSSPSSRSAAEVGWLQPKRRVSRNYTLTHGDAAAALSAKWYKPLTRWQLEMARDWGAVDESGRFLHRRCGSSIVRQAGKSVDAVAWTVYLATVLHYKVLYTAHNYSTTMEMRHRIQGVFGRRPNDPIAQHPDANRLVVLANNKTSQEAIELRGGGVIAFSTRTEAAALGYSFDVVIIDEAQEYTVAQQRVILPTTTSGAAHNTQFVLIGTPRRPNSKGDIWEPMRDAAWSDEPDDDLCWWEYGVDEPGDPSDEGRWWDVNPSLREGVANLDAIRTGFRQMRDSGDVQGFCQEYLGYWLPKASELAEQSIISVEDWEACRVPPSQQPIEEDAPAIYAIKFSVDGSTGCVAACRAPEGGRPFATVVAVRPLSLGVGWFEEFVAEREGTAGVFVVDGGGAAQDLCDRLARRGVPEELVVRPAAKDVATACAKLLDMVATHTLAHEGQPGLIEAAAHVMRRPIGRSGFGFAGIGGIDVMSLEALALALWGSGHALEFEEQEISL